jgi:hypothetical protein
VTDFLSQKRDEIARRLLELKPAVEEYRRLEAAAAALAGLSGSRSASARDAGRRRREPRRPRGAARPTAAAAKPKRAARPKRSPGRPATRHAASGKGRGTRAGEALSFVHHQPGITVTELASKMGIKHNYLYRVLPGLEQEGKLTMQGRRWYVSDGWDRNGP